MTDESKSNHGHDSWIKERSDTNAQKIPLCQKCNVQHVKMEKKRAVTMGGIISVLPFFYGLMEAVLGDPVDGFLIVIIALIVGSIGRKKTVMICPLCGTEGWAN